MSGNTERDTLASRLAATLPNATPALLDVAMTAFRDINAAVRAGDDAGLTLAYSLYDAVVWKLNGGTFFGAAAGPEASAAVVAQHCAAPAGAVPLWGQHGEFQIEVEGIRAVVRFDGRWMMTSVHFEFHAIDPDTPFISETGYLSHFAHSVSECPVDAAAALYMRAILVEKGRQMIDAEYRRSVAACERFPWVRELAPSTNDTRTYVESSGQLALVL